MQRIDVKRALSYVHVGGNVIEGQGQEALSPQRHQRPECRNIALTQDDIAVIDAFTKLQSAVLGRLGADCPLVTLDGSYMRPTTISRGFQPHTRRMRTAARDHVFTACVTRTLRGLSPTAAT